MQGASSFFMHFLVPNQYLTDVIDADNTNIPLYPQREILAGRLFCCGKLEYLLHRVACAAKGEGLLVGGIISLR